MSTNYDRRILRKILIEEARQIKREIVAENIKRKKYVKTINHVLNENKVFINSRYLSQQEINENIFKDIMGFGGDMLGNLLPGFIGDIKQKIAGGLMDAVGLNKRSYFGRVLVNVLEEIKYSEIMEYFSDWKTGCPKMIDTVLRGLSDGLLEGIMVKIFGMKAEPGSQSGLVGTGREALLTTINDKIIPTIKPMIEKFICSMDISGMLSKIKDMATGKASVKDLLPAGLGGGAAASAAAPSPAESPKPSEPSDLQKLMGQK